MIFQPPLNLTKTNKKSSDNFRIFWTFLFNRCFCQRESKVKNMLFKILGDLVFKSISSSLWKIIWLETEIYKANLSCPCGLFIPCIIRHSAISCFLTLKPCNLIFFLTTCKLGWISPSTSWVYASVLFMFSLTIYITLASANLLA